MSFHKRKKKHNNPSSVILSSTPDNPISFSTLSDYPIDEKDQIDKQLAANNHQSDTNGVAKMICDNNNKGSIILNHKTEKNKELCDVEVDHDLKNQTNHLSDMNQVSSLCKTSTTASVSKSKFIMLTRLFKPWKWKRKKKSEKNLKGMLY